MSTLEKEQMISVAGGRIRCRRCQAMSKHSRLQCKKPALRGKRVCAFHGGKSTGPKTEQGKANSAAANIKHGKYTKQAQTRHSAALAQLSQLEDAMYLLGMSDAPRFTGRKATGYCKLTSLEEVRTMLAKTITE